MAYNIAVTSTDGIHIDQSFREAEEFLIYSVDDNGKYEISEKRKIEPDDEELTHNVKFAEKAASGGCGKVCGGGTGCGGAKSSKLSLIQDCRSLVCTQIGFKALKHLEKKAISTFEIDCQVNEALEKIISYFDKVDKHQSLRGIAKSQAKDEE